VIQQGQVFKLKGKGADGEPLWAYRYRLDGRGSARPQVGGFASRAEAQKALAKELARLGPGGRGAMITLGELVDEYLGLHQADRVTIAKRGHERLAAARLSLVGVEQIAVSIHRQVTEQARTFGVVAPRPLEVGKYRVDRLLLEVSARPSGPSEREPLDERIQQDLEHARRGRRIASEDGRMQTVLFVSARRHPTIFPANASISDAFDGGFST
jgi:hypothetical protein